LALKFKQSCADFRPQNGQIKVPDFQTPYLKKNPKISKIPVHGSIDHKKAKGLQMIQFMDGFLYC
jgi:hypothetical protein